MTDRGDPPPPPPDPRHPPPDPPPSPPPDPPLPPPPPVGRRGSIAHRWGIPEALIGFAAGLLLAGLATSAAERAAGYHHGPIPVAVTAADVLALWVGLVGAAWWASRRRGTGDLRRDFGLRFAGWRDVVGGAVVGLASQYLLLPAVYWPFEQLDHGLRHQLDQPAQNDTGAAHTWVAIVVITALLAVGSPIVEELFFRGLLLRGLLGASPTPVALVACGLLFGLAHFELAQFGGLALFGVVLAGLAWWTGRLGPGIAAHAAFNAAAVLAVVHHT